MHQSWFVTGFTDPHGTKRLFRFSRPRPRRLGIDLYSDAQLYIMVNTLSTLLILS